MLALLKKYWDSYGGWASIFTSPFTWLSLSITILSSTFWTEDKWIDTPISILPSLLGFTLASYSLWLAFGNEKLNRILSKLKDGNAYSKYMEINTSFIHFILVHIICLILSISVKTVDLDKYFYLSNLGCWNSAIKVFEYSSIVLNGFIFFLFFYAIFCMFAAIVGFVGIASGLDLIYRKEYIDVKKDQQKEKEKVMVENVMNCKMIEKLDEELKLLKTQNSKALLEIEDLKNNQKKRDIFDHIKDLIK